MDPAQDGAGREPGSGRPPRPFERGLVVLAWVLAVAAALWLAGCAWRSRGWPVINDTGLFHYVALRVSQGAVPYRDVFDFQMPGTLLVHLGVVEWLGTGDLAWRAFDLAWLAVAFASIALFLRPFGRLAAFAGCVLYGAWHLALGAFNTGQRDFLVGVLLFSAALALVRALERRRGGRASFAAGLLLGAAASIKPQALLLLLVLAPLAVRHARARSVSPVAETGRLLAGSAVVPLACLAWLVQRGGLEAFADMLTGYLLPLHPEMDRQPVWRLLEGWLTNPFTLPLLLSGLVSAVAWREASRERTRQAVLCAGFAYGLLHLSLQRKGWTYHFEPAAIFLCAWAASALRSLAGGRAPRPLLGALVLLLCGRALLVIGARVEGQLETPGRNERILAAVRGLEADLRELVPTGRKAQVLDMGIVGVAALLRLELAQPTRITYSHPLYLVEGHPYTLRLREEFLADLRGDPPAALVVFGFHPATGDNGQLVAFPELARELDARWRVVRERADYRVLARVDGG